MAATYLVTTLRSFSISFFPSLYLYLYVSSSLDIYAVNSEADRYRRGASSSEWYFFIEPLGDSVVARWWREAVKRDISSVAAALLLLAATVSR